MDIAGTAIADTFAEAFRLRYARLVVTAADDHWLAAATATVCGYGTSVLGCDAEVGAESPLAPDATPDGRPGVAIMLFAFTADDVGRAVANRTGQCLLTCPTVSVYDGLPAAEERRPLGAHVRYFGDGFEKTKVIAGRRYWRVPVMDGEFITEETTGMVRAVGGGNFLVLAESQPQALAACEAAIEAMKKVPNVIMPFPGGVVRSGSKVGSKYKTMFASTNDAFCPTLKGLTNTQLSPEIESVMEIVIDGLTDADIRKATYVGIKAACELGAAKGIRRISAGNYGGKLGQFQYHLREIMNDKSLGEMV